MFSSAEQGSACHCVIVALVCSALMSCENIYEQQAKGRTENKSDSICRAQFKALCITGDQAQACRIEVSRSSEVSFPGGQGWVEVELPGVCPGCLPPGTSLCCPLALQWICPCDCCIHSY